MKSAYRYVRSIQFTASTLVRMLADLCMAEMALLAAFLVRYLTIVNTTAPGGSAAGGYWQYVGRYVHWLWLLPLVAMGVYLLSGLYSYARAYRLRYKVLIVLQAVALSYLVSVLVTYLFPDTFAVPRSVLLMGWGLTTALMVGSRLWSKVWKAIAVAEAGTASAQTAGRDAGLPSSDDVLVIGGAGYIGSALLPRLLEDGHRVRLFDGFVYGREPVQEVLDHPNLEVIEGDFRQVAQVLRATRGAGSVIHLGAIVGDPACALDEELTIETNLLATRMIAEVAKEAGIRRFIFASTCSTYGTGAEILDERAALKPVSLYAKSKVASEKVLMQMSGSHFRPTILRFGTVHGLSGRTRFDLVVNLLTAKAVTEKEIPVFGGSQWRPFLHVDDAAQAIHRMLDAPLDLVGGEIFNVGSRKENYTILDVAKIIQKRVPEATIVQNGSDHDLRDYRVDFSKISQRVAFVPRWTVEEGVTQVVLALEAGRVTDYTDTHCSNVLYLNEHLESSYLQHGRRWALEMIEM